MAEVVDAELVRRARSGDPAGLGALLARHRPGMLAAAYAMLGYGPDAQDAVQDAFLIALTRLESLRDPQAAGPWLRGIVRHRCRAARRSSTPVPIGVIDDRLLSAMVDDPLALLERRALRDWTWHALDGLTPPLRAVVLLRYFTEASGYEQISELCGVPVGTVRSRLSQARVKLAEQLRVTAESAHPDIAVRMEQSRRDALEMLNAFESGEVHRTLRQTWSPHAEVGLPDGSLARSSARFERGIVDNYVDGVRYRLSNVVAARDLVVWETDFLNPADKPDHCPPSGVWLHFMTDGRVDRFRLLHSSRPGAQRR